MVALRWPICATKFLACISIFLAQSFSLFIKIFRYFFLFVNFYSLFKFVFFCLVLVDIPFTYQTNKNVGRAVWRLQAYIGYFVMYDTTLT